MDARLAAVAVAVVVVVVGVALALGGGGESPESASTATSTTPQATSQPPGGGGGGPGGSGGQGSGGAGGSTAAPVDVEGDWSGVYTSRYGSGEWEWVIRGVGGGRYEGCLRTTGPYESNGWLPIQVNVEGDRITVGVVGGGFVTFTGTVSGGSASGTWSVVGGQDGGDWSGSKRGPAGSLPCSPGGGETSQPPESTTTEELAGGLECNPPPPPAYSQAFQELLDSAVSVLGEDSLSCIGSTLLAGVQYAASYALTGYQHSQAQAVGQAIAEELTARGWEAQFQVASDSLHVMAAKITGTGVFQAMISIQVNDDGTVDLTIQLQPAQYG